MTRPQQPSGDSPCTAGYECGFGASRITLAGLRDSRTRQEALARGRRLLVRGRGLPGGEDRALLEAHRDLVLAYEAIMPLGQLSELRGAAADWPVPLRLAPVPAASAAAEDGGFESDELDRLTGLDLKGGGLFTGIVVRLGATDEVFRTSLLVASATWARELDATLSISLAPEADEPATIWRVIEAAFAAQALPEVDVVPDALPGSARDNVRTAAAAVIRTVIALPPVRERGFAWTIRQGALRVHGYRSAAGIECLVTIGDGSLPIGSLRLPVALPATGAGTATPALTGLARPVRCTALADQPHTVRFEPPLAAQGPLILRLEAARGS